MQSVCLPSILVYVRRRADTARGGRRPAWTCFLVQFVGYQRELRRSLLNLGLWGMAHTWKHFRASLHCNWAYYHNYSFKARAICIRHAPAQPPALRPRGATATPAPRCRPHALCLCVSFSPGRSPSSRLSPSPVTSVPGDGDDCSGSSSYRRAYGIRPESCSCSHGGVGGDGGRGRWWWWWGGIKGCCVVQRWETGIKEIAGMLRLVFCFFFLNSLLGELLLPSRI